MKICLTAVILAVFVITPSAQGFDCPVTTVFSEDPVTPWQDSPHYAWHGTEELAVYIPRDGNWVGMGPDRDYGDKSWWWQEGYDARKDPTPNLIITANRLDEPSETITVDNATSGYNESWNAMLIGMRFPSAGCWEVIGSYGGAQLRLIFNVGQKQ